MDAVHCVTRRPDEDATTLSALLVRNASVYGEHLAFVDVGVAVTHSQLAHEADRLAAGLHRAGLRSGDRIAILAYNGLPFVQIIFAASRIGVIVSAINWRLTSSEIEMVLANDSPAMVFVSATLAPLLNDSIRERYKVPAVVIDGELEAFTSLESLKGLAADVPDVIVKADDPIFFIHTAWTDGRPKAAVLTHRNLLTSALQLRDIWALKRTDVHLCALPLFHITALSLMLATACAAGCSVLQARFTASEAIGAIETHGVTLMGEFSPMLAGLLQEPDANGRLITLRHVCGLDAPEVIGHFHTTCPQAKFWAVYGQSEAGGFVTMAPYAAADGSAGYPLPQCAVRVVDASGLPLPPGQEGEIVVSGPTVFDGYWGRSDVSSTTLRDGWLHTGDLGKLDTHGRLVFSGRLPSKELIKSGGENVYPDEVEKVLLSHPAVIDVAVIGVADKRWGESVRAVCVSNSEIEPQELIDYVGNQIAGYKRPRSVVFVDSLPRNPDGSHDRNAIKVTYGDQYLK